MSFRDQLRDAIEAAKAAYLARDRERALNSDVDISELRANSTYLLNLRALFMFAIPAIQDYGLAIKLYDV